MGCGEVYVAIGAGVVVLAVVGTTSTGSVALDLLVEAKTVVMASLSCVVSAGIGVSFLKGSEEIGTANSLSPSGP